MKCWRITKYDPAFRDNKDRFTKETWTSISDVGQDFEGEKLTIEEYLRVEQLYVDAVIGLTKTLGIATIEIRGLEKHEEKLDPGDWASIYSQDIYRVFEYTTEAICLPIEDVGSICRLVLREQLWCKLESTQMFVHFGYDFYMYLACHAVDADVIDSISASGLFLEEMNSPYRDIGEKTVREAH